MIAYENCTFCLSIYGVPMIIIIILVLYKRVYTITILQLLRIVLA